MEDTIIHYSKDQLVPLVRKLDIWDTRTLLGESDITAEAGQLFFDFCTKVLGSENPSADDLDLASAVASAICSQLDNAPNAQEGEKQQNIANALALFAESKLQAFQETFDNRVAYARRQGATIQQRSIDEFNEEFKQWNQKSHGTETHSLEDALTHLFSVINTGTRWKDMFHPMVGDIGETYLIYDLFGPDPSSLFAQAQHEGVAA